MIKIVFAIIFQKKNLIHHQTKFIKLKRKKKKEKKTLPIPMSKAKNHLTTT
jgi:hypothetical protein